MMKCRSSAPGKLLCFSKHAHFLALLYVEGNLDLKTGLQPAKLGYVAAGIASRTGLGVLNFQFDFFR